MKVMVTGGTGFTGSHTVKAFVDAGRLEFINWYRDFPSDHSMVAWIEDVAPKLCRP